MEHLGTIIEQAEIGLARSRLRTPEDIAQWNFQQGVLHGIQSLPQHLNEYYNSTEREIQNGR